MSTVNADKVADFFIRFAHKHGDCITNKKLQKLVYYAQAWHLAFFDKPLFDGRLEAWVMGPVQPELYHEYKKFLFNPISVEPSTPIFSKKVATHLQNVVDAYWRFTAWELERMTHEEDPWQKARKGLPPDAKCTNEILHKDMRQYYKKRLNEKEN